MNDYLKNIQGDDDIQQLLLMNAFSNPEMQQWLPFILFSDKNMQDKLIMMQYLQMMEGQGKISCSSNIYPFGSLCGIFSPRRLIRNIRSFIGSRITYDHLCEVLRKRYTVILCYKGLQFLS